MFGRVPPKFSPRDNKHSMDKFVTNQGPTTKKYSFAGGGQNCKASKNSRQSCYVKPVKSCQFSAAASFLYSLAYIVVAVLFPLLID